MTEGTGQSRRSVASVQRWLSRWLGWGFIVFEIFGFTCHYGMKTAHI